MIIFTNTERYADKILKEQIQNTKKLINSQLKELKVITKEAINLVEKKFDMNELAILLNESWRLKNLSNKITTSSIDELYEYCLTKGAKGGKLLGAEEEALLLVGENNTLNNLSKILKNKTSSVFSKNRPTRF